MCKKTERILKGVREHLRQPSVLGNGVNDYLMKSPQLLKTFQCKLCHSDSLIASPGCVSPESQQNHHEPLDILSILDPAYGIPVSIVTDRAEGRK